ncbi:hypothetical protein ACLB2K_051109 [Fragaria x ananassa]
MKKTKPANAKRNNAEEEEKPCNILQLPDHITQEIFGRLPLETLTQCKFVCKSWRRSLSNPDFTQFLVSRAPACHFLIDMNENKHVLANLRSPGNPNNMVLKLSNPNIDSYDWLNNSDIVGSSNGFLCSYRRNNHGVYFNISNPIITKESIALPIFKDRLTDDGDGIHAFGFGFGFSSISHVYKVTVFRERNPPCNNKAEFMVLTVGSGIWRSIGNVSSLIDTHYGVFHNGFLHWICKCKRSPNSRYIRAFDVESEHFNSLPMPPCGETIATLGVLNDSLSVTCFSSQKLQVWLRKEDGGKTFWIIELEIYERCLGYPNEHVCQVLKIIKRKKALLLRDFKLSLYTIETRSLVGVQIDGIPYEARLAMEGVHTPTILSPKDIIRNYVSKHSEEVDETTKRKKKKTNQKKHKTASTRTT